MKFATRYTAALRLLLVSALLAVLTACGGGGGGADAQPAPAAEAPPPPDPPQTQRLAIKGCQDVRLHDTGTVAYITVEKGCTPAAPLTLSVLDGAGEPVKIPFAGLGVDTDIQVGDWARRAAIVKRGTWRTIPKGGWGWRDGAGLLAKDGGLYLLGGWNNEVGTTSDVWFTRDAVNWTRITEQAPWIGRHGAGWVVHKDRLYVVGGDYTDDVWSSADGLNWAQHAVGAAFGRLYAPNAASFNGELLVYNGQRLDGTNGMGENRVWASTDDGAVWQEVGTVPYAPRGLIHGPMIFNGRIYVVGGGLKGYVEGVDGADTLAEFNDVWSSADGREWRMETSDAGFAPRYHHAVLATSHGCYVANGSLVHQLQTTREVFFARDCVKYAPVSDPSPMGNVHATSMVEFAGSIIVLGGHKDEGGLLVWQYFPE